LGGAQAENNSARRGPHLKNSNQIVKRRRKLRSKHRGWGGEQRRRLEESMINSFVASFQSFPDSKP
jgi:hypothetical protein